MNTAVRVVSQHQDLSKNIQVVKLPVPEPGNGEALVCLTLRPVHFFDLLLASGKFPGMQGAVPFTLGSEAVGVVKKPAAAGSHRFKAGQRVVAAMWTEQMTGTWQDYIAVAEDRLLPVPDALDDKTAAAAIGNPATAVGLLEVAAVPKGEYLVQSAANGVLGRLIIQLAKHSGIKTINIVRRQDQVQELKDLGADEVLDSSCEDIAQRVEAITGGKSAWAGIDAVAGSYTNKVLNATRPRGTVFLIDGLSASTADVRVAADGMTSCRHYMYIWMGFKPGGKVAIAEVVVARRSLTGFDIGDWLAGDGPETAAERLARTLRLLEDKVMTPLAGEVFPLTRVHDAIAASQKSGRGGKVFLSSA